MTNSLSQAEAALVLRHLLKGCPVCKQVTDKIWKLGDRVPFKLEGVE